MVTIIDFIINTVFTKWIIEVIQLFLTYHIVGIILSMILLYVIFKIGVIIFLLFILFVERIIKITLKKEISINCHKISLFLSSLGMVLLIILTFTVIKNEKIKVIEPNRNKVYREIAGNKDKFKNFDRRYYISLTKEYTLKKIGLDKYIDIKKTLHFDNYELNKLIEKIDTMIEIDNNLELSLDEKKHFKDEVISSKNCKDINNIRNKIYDLIEEKDYNKFKRKEKINLKKQKEILKDLKNL